MVCNCAVVVSSGGAELVTSTVVAVAPTDKLKFCVTVLFNCTCTPLTLVVVKPVAVAVTVYEPTGRLASR